MSIVHASILPELNAQFIENEGIKNAVKEIEGELYFMRPDTIVVIRTNEQADDCIKLSIAECIKNDTGDCVMRNDLKLVMNIKAEFKARGRQHWLYLDANKTMNTSIESSLLSLCEHSLKMKYVDIELPLPSEHFPLMNSQTAGDYIGSVLLSTDDRISLIAIGSSSEVEKDFFHQLQKAITQKNLSGFGADSQHIGAVGPFETTITSFIKAFHGTQFDSHLLYTETTTGSDAMVVDMSMS